jgi:hypothetical protein
VIDADDDGSPVASTVDEGHELRIGFTLAGEGVTLLTLTPTGP